MSEKKLLSCPFCGGEAEVCGYYFIQCTKCGSSTLTHTNREKAIESWNTRVPMQKIVERLEESKGTYIDEHGKELYQEDYFIDIDEAIKIVKAGAK